MAGTRALQGEISKIWARKRPVTRYKWPNRQPQNGALPVTVATIQRSTVVKASSPNSVEPSKYTLRELESFSNDKRWPQWYQKLDANALFCIMSGKSYGLRLCYASLIIIWLRLACAGLRVRENLASAKYNDGVSTLRERQGQRFSLNLSYRYKVTVLDRNT